MDNKKRFFLGERIALCFLAVMQGAFCYYASVLWESSNAAFASSSLFLAESSLGVLALLLYLHFVNIWKKGALLLFVVMQIFNYLIASNRFIVCLVILTGFQKEFDLRVLDQDKNDFSVKTAIFWGIMTLSVFATSMANFKFAQRLYFRESADEEKTTTENNWNDSPV